jgi:ADP-ribose pyrophosphatase YjhB (NUDIX family)
LAFLAGYDIGKFERPSVTSDVVAVTLRSVETGDWRAPTRLRASVLLIRRGVPPFKGLWALPGGFLRKGESLDECARRELKEETGLAASALLPIGVFSAPGRDPRGWIISGAFLSIVSTGANEVRGGDDAAEAVWCGISLDVAPEGGKALLLLTPENGQPPFEIALQCKSDDVGHISFNPVGTGAPFAFDHASIIASALMRLRSEPAVRRLAFAFLPEAFTLAELHDVFRLFGIADDNPANFRRKIMPYVEPTGDASGGAGHRPAALFRKRILICSAN